MCKILLKLFLKNGLFFKILSNFHIAIYIFFKRVFKKADYEYIMQ